MKYLNIISAVIWGIFFIRYLLGDYQPDSFVVGFSMFLTCMFFVVMFLESNEIKE